MATDTRPSMEKRGTNPRVCVYCGRRATTKDHVPPRCLLEKPYPANLLTVDSCALCNRGWSKDEEYWLIALSHVGFTKTLASKLDEGGQVFRALDRNERLDDRIRNSLHPGPDNRVYFTPEKERLARIAAKIALGLYSSKYGRSPRLDKFGPVEIHHHLESGLVERQHFISTATGRVPLATVNNRFEFKLWTVVQPGTFAYIFVRTWFRYGLSSRLACLMVFHGTLLAAVGCPWPGGRSAGVGRQRKTDPFTLELFST
jgi:hypothetical protein